MPHNSKTNVLCRLLKFVFRQLLSKQEALIKLMFVNLIICFSPFEFTCPFKLFNLSVIIEFSAANKSVVI
jgi:hypothetical protein